MGAERTSPWLTAVEDTGFVASAEVSSLRRNVPEKAFSGVVFPSLVEPWPGLSPPPPPGQPAQSGGGTGLGRGSFRMIVPFAFARAHVSGPDEARGAV